MSTLFVAICINLDLLSPGKGALGTEAELGLHSFSHILIGTYLLTALGIALTQGRFVEATAEHIRRASRALNPKRPTDGAKVLSVQLWFATIGFAVMTFHEPPAILVEATREWGCAAAAPMTWAAIISIGVASFGANAHAAMKAM